jgi:hypothetical protein
MHGWPAVAAVLVALVLLGPAVAWLGRRYGRSVKGGLVLGSILLGFGHVIDRPSREAVEAAGEEADRKGPPAPGDPPLD